MSDLGPAAVALADQLARLSHDDALAVRQAADVLAPGMLDQVDAARDEAALLVASLAAGRAPVMVEAPEWLVLLVAEAFLAYVTGLAETCPCVPSPERPAPVHAAAWRPGVIACASHGAYLFALRGEAARTCDRCGTVAAEVFTDAIVAGPVTFQVGLCPDCQADLRRTPTHTAVRSAGPHRGRRPGRR